VANYDFPITEHGGYWTNFSEVMARIVYVISDSRLRREALDTVRHAHSQPARSPVQEQLFRAIEPGMPRMEKHRRQLVGEVWRYLLAFLLGIGAVAWFGRTLGESVSERLAALPIVPSWLPLGRTDVHWLLGTLVIGYAALMVIGLLRLGGEFRSWLARERDLPNAEESEPEQSIAAPLAQAH